MGPTEFNQLVSYSAWATDRILATCEPLTPEAFAQPVTPDPGWGSLRGLLVHALDAEYGWRTVLEGESDSGVLEEVDFPDVATLRTRWAEEHAAWARFAAALTPERLADGYGERPDDGPRVWQTIMHVLFHSAQHRSEAAAILTGMGHSPGELDLDVYLRATQG